MSKQFEDLRNDLKGLDKQLKMLSGKVQQIGDQVDYIKTRFKTEDSSDNSTKEEITPKSKASFRIDLYPYQGHCRGRIVDLLSSDKKAFDDLDINTITNFMSNHLPKTKSIVPYSEAGTKSVNKDETLRNKTKDEPISRMNNMIWVSPIKRLGIVHPSSRRSLHNIVAETPFEAQVSVEFDNIHLGDESSNEYNISIYAHALDGRSKTLIGVGGGKALLKKESTISVKCSGFKVGSWRLVALLEVNDKISKSGSSYMFKGDLVNIY